MADSDRLRILIVEPDGGWLAPALLALGHAVDAVCPTLAEAAVQAGQHPPELVCLDARLAASVLEWPAGLQDAAVLLQSANPADLQVQELPEAVRPLGGLFPSLSPGELRLAVELAVARHRWERAMRQHEARSETVLRSLSEGVIVADLAGLIVCLNPAAERITGWTQDGAAGRSLHEVFRLYQASGAPAALEVRLAAPPRRVWLTTHSGRRVEVQDRAAPWLDAQGRLAGLVIGVHLRDGAASGPLDAPVDLPPRMPWADLPDSLAEPLLWTDGRGRVTYANAAAQRWFAAAPPEGRALWDLLPAAEAPQRETLAHALLHRQPAACEVAWGERRLQLRASPLAEGLLVLLLDVSARADEAGQHHRADRLESLGLLARGFAHDFNNLLTVLLGNLSMAELRLGPAAVPPELQAAHQATQQAQSLVQQLLTFARGGVPIKRTVQPEDVIGQFFRQHGRVPGIRYAVETAPALPALEADPAQLRRLLGNLVRNAEQAQPGGGLVRVRAFAPDPAAEAVPGVVIEVEDEGEGIAPEHLPRLFEPYFSTRQAANATGLGLTVCDFIARAHGGRLQVENRPGRGVCARLWLPAAPVVAAVPAAPAARPPKPAAALPRVLVLEDDPLVRSLLVRHLAREGCEVVESVEGGETVRLYQEALTAGRPFALVILDLSIPDGMGGAQAMEQLRRLDPQVLAMVSSGYSDDPVMARPGDYGFAAVLPKPYEPADLQRLVRELLDHAAA